MQIKELSDFLEVIAPLSYQEDYDNAGLIVGNKTDEVKSALISLDCTEEIVQEAIDRGCDIIISHHPIVFKGLKRFNNDGYVERAVIKAIKNGIALYAIHTNFDNVFNGVNARLCDVIGIKNYKVLAPKTGLIKKLVTFCPTDNAEEIRNALFKAGAGNIGKYSECSFNTEGLGTFKGSEDSQPYVGVAGLQHQEKETRIEVIYPATIERKVMLALLESHPYEEVAYETFTLSNPHQNIGAGMIGWLPGEQDELSFLRHIKSVLNCKVIRHTALKNKPISKVAVCGGSGSFLLKAAIQAGADVFITSDFKYHEFFDADQKIVIADVGHFESEQFTQHLLMELIQKKFPNFALRLTEKNTNPINYFI